jgi:hypothetical protein
MQSAGEQTHPHSILLVAALFFAKNSQQLNVGIATRTLSYVFFPSAPTLAAVTITFRISF